MKNQIFQTGKASLSQLVFGSLLLLAFSFIFGPGVYASFILTDDSGVPTDSSSYAFGYGYGVGYGYGYGYGYGSTDFSVYGHTYAQGPATSVSATAGQTTATVSYTTSYTAKNRVHYSIISDMASLSDLSAFQTGSQSISLSGLTCNATYYYRVSSTDAGGSVWYDTDTYHTFTTSACDAATSGGTGGGGGGPALNDKDKDKISPVVPVVAMPTDLITTTLKYKTLNSQVITLQQLLKSLGYLNIKKPTNYFGVSTRAALKQYQKDRGLRASGNVDARTLAALNNDITNPLLAKHAAVFTKNLSYRSSGVIVNLLQEKLKDLGFFTGETTNYFGLKTKKAVTDFQKQSGIKPANGLVGPATRALLNK